MSDLAYWEDCPDCDGTGEEYDGPIREPEYYIGLCMGCSGTGGWWVDDEGIDDLDDTDE